MTTRPYDIATVVVPGADLTHYTALGVRPGLITTGARPMLRFAVADPVAATARLRKCGYQVPTDDPTRHTDRVGISYEFHSGATDSDQGPIGADNAGLTLDHVVIHSYDADATIAALAGRIGLDLRLDQVGPQGIRQLFFRTGPAPAAIVEALVTAPNDADGTSPDSDAESTPLDALWGIAWRSEDLDADRDRLTALGFELSPTRAGVKPGTRVLTVRDEALGTRTLLIETALVAA